jgi:cyclophilin family peptidyl-prolyl cis-trans isomerase
MKSRYILILVLIFCFPILNALHFARWSTSMGSFTAELYDEQTPITSTNFISLANSGFYNDLIFHRVIEGFVIQDGCPYGTGYGGPGYTIPDEFYPGFHHDQAGILAMAHSAAPNSAGSQYYITLAPQSHLDGLYAIFGKVVQGLDVVLAIGSVPTDANDHPVTPVEIDTLRILDLEIGSLTPPNSTAFVCPVNEAQMFVVEAYSDDYAISYEWYVDDVLQQDAGDFLFEYAFQTAGTHSVKCRVSNEDWSHEIVWDVQSEGSASGDEIQPVQQVSVYPNPFTGTTSIRAQSGFTGKLSASIYDLRGRLLVSAPDGLNPGGEWLWDGCNAQGDKLPAGMYILKTGQNGRFSYSRLVKL